MVKEVYCDKCLKEIKVRDDLVTATLLFEVVPYHEDCYAKDLKGIKTLFLDNQPINGFSGNLLSLLAFVLLISSIFIDDKTIKYFAILTIIPILYRLFSYFVYERHIEK